MGIFDTVIAFIHCFISDHAAPTLSCRVHGAGSECPPAFCPGDVVYYTFDAGVPEGATNGVTLWTFPLTRCPNHYWWVASSVFRLPQWDNPDRRIPCESCYHDETCGEFTAGNRGRDPNGYCVVSEFSFTAAAYLNNAVVKCVTGLTNETEQTERANTTIQIGGWLYNTPGASSN